ncbi:hypothetical protein PACID_20660 [Acidipropionibacterium acidipropionici ATCC 4875]|uniref:Uncharacterized protein n=1 Tax=Acidipropionibacterium acidipropionici (strain ATCC 4875 / DSM 20272 / JCM 6432 / NBRC 12425 / NCIMB 8070 / 4) TaxID=1171373 RepID=K7S5I1_ACIA4|nr:hypothetical protein PACID_20660 [Acidipropionibacterium acidipropionici ATCC 4875]
MPGIVSHCCSSISIDVIGDGRCARAGFVLESVNLGPRQEKTLAARGIRGSVLTGGPGR